MRLIDIGFGNRVAADRILTVIHPGSSPVKRLVAEARDRGTLIDATSGRRTLAVIVTDSDHVVLSARDVDDISRDADGATEVAD